ncbi:putative immunoglobulin-blocking virulence protein [Mycoplasma zalophi]|uniref:putative immunoglobulin-blocking virulence protein n=1 Tax=Mycoplasma zalophi TaxID=191287 RepID=UPI001C10FA41|nr:putative immunoglobulin-blocking virulence protein [Mycoplasma zalophi]MBU4690943.1 putative immunoglobulin-blocking virulence protein [Mycoplasma zalophi]
MKFFKTKKQKILFVTTGSVFIASIVASFSIYLTNKTHKQVLFYNSQGKAKINFVDGNNVDLANTVPSNSDSNLKKIVEETPPPKPEIPPVIEKIPEPEPEPEKPKPIPKPEEPKPKPEPIPEPPKPEPQPVPEAPKPKPIPKPEPPKPKPETKPKKSQSNSKIVVAGVEVDADITFKPPRKQQSYDVDNNIVNRVPYVNDSTDKLNSITVTKELRTAAINKAIGVGTKEGLASFWFKNIVADALEAYNQKPEEFDLYINNHRNVYSKAFEKWSRLFDSDNVVNFLKEEVKPQYQSMHFKSKDHRYIWLYSNLDWTKFTKLSSNAEAQLKKGYVLDPDNAYIREDGSLDSYSYGQPDRFNSVTSRMSRDNSTKRVFSYNSYWWRSPYDVENGNYPGWTKKDANNDPIFEGLIRSGDGIKTLHMTRDVKTNDPDQINDGYVVEIDAANEAGYSKTLELINKLKAKNANIVSYRIKNMGKNSSAQAFKPILRALPDNILQVELFFSAQATNTSSLIALEDKHIKELSLYTLGNSLQDEWSINPFALRNTAWVNTNDYNVSFDYARNKDIATRITFNTLAFDKEDYLENDHDHLKRINLGLRMAYYTRNNEPIFQGSFGPGLNPDNNEGNNSYATMLDFSRVQQIKSLSGLVFRDVYKPSNKPRKITKVRFFNDKDSYEISEKDLFEAGLENMITPSRAGVPKIAFSNGSLTTKFKIKENDLTPQAISNLVKFKKYVQNENPLFSEIVVINPGNEALKSKLESVGFEVEFEHDYEIS